MKTHIQTKDREEKIKQLVNDINSLDKSEKEKHDALLETKLKQELNFEEQKRTLKS